MNLLQCDTAAHVLGDWWLLTVDNFSPKKGSFSQEYEVVFTVNNLISSLLNSTHQIHYHYKS